MQRYNASEVMDGMKAGMRRLAKGVTVIASSDGTNRYAMTASAVTSLSDDPVSLLVCVHKHSSMALPLERGNDYSVNLLSAGHDEISDVCSGRTKAADRFGVGNWRTHKTSGLPYLADAQAVFFCRCDGVHAYGTHLICIGRIVEVAIADQTVAPLIYLDGSYTTARDASAA